jgi:hypothetical protein
MTRADIAKIVFFDALLLGGLAFIVHSCVNGLAVRLDVTPRE